MTFEEAIEMYRNIYKRFEKVECNEWGINGAMIELSKQVGDLSKWIMIKERYYALRNEKYDNVNEHIGNELADILGQIIRIADYYSIDLIEAHLKAREDEDRSLKKMGV